MTTFDKAFYDAERVAFESYASGDFPTERYGDSYVCLDTEIAWHAWKSRAMLAAAAAVSAEPGEWEHHAQKLTRWLHCMSYNDSYFGEPAGLVKQVAGELYRLIGKPQTEPAARWQQVLYALFMELERITWVGEDAGWDCAIKAVQERILEIMQGKHPEHVRELYETVTKGGGA